MRATRADVGAITRWIEADQAPTRFDGQIAQLGRADCGDALLCRRIYVRPHDALVPLRGSACPTLLLAGPTIQPGMRDLAETQVRALDSLATPNTR
jgi:hypothetical protein